MPRHSKFTPEQFAKFKQILSEGNSEREAARGAGVSYTAARYFLDPVGVSLRNKKWQDTNREKKLAYDKVNSKKYYQEHKEQAAIYQREYQKTHREQINTRTMAYYWKNKKKLRAYYRERYQRKKLLK